LDPLILLILSFLLYYVSFSLLISFSLSFYVLSTTKREKDTIEKEREGEDKEKDMIQS
jgi:hypothetical protein